MNKLSIILVSIGIIMLAAIGYLFYSPSPTPVETHQDATPQNTKPTGQATFNYTNSGYEAKSVRFTQGEKVTLTITSDQPDEIHLHGYDLSKATTPGQTSIIEFTADKTGRFELELEKSGTSLGFIEVYPKE
jgi:FtsP/CotA-like multicopper oxidase with cupredoxin domain